MSIQNSTYRQITKNSINQMLDLLATQIGQPMYHNTVKVIDKFTTLIDITTAQSDLMPGKDNNETVERIAAFRQKINA